MEEKQQAAAGLQYGQKRRKMKSEIQDAKLKRKNCSSLGVSPLSGGEESGPRSRGSLRWWSGFLGHSL